MKIHLSVDSKPKKGYKNFRTSQIPKEADEDVVIVESLVKLDEYIDNAECDEIHIDHALEYLPFELIDKAVQYWVSKLRKNGEILIQSSELVTICKGVHDLNINPAQAQGLLYGRGDKKSCPTFLQILPVLKTLNIKVIQRQTVDYDFLIVGRRD